jgi:hypothetical protein
MIDFNDSVTPDQAALETYLDVVINVLLNMTSYCASNGTAAYCIPGTVRERGEAKAADVVQTQVLLCDIDSGDIAEKLAHASRFIGAPTLIVESGGKTDEGQDKIHAYWKLTEPAEGDELSLVAKLRHELAVKIGADAHFQSLHQPIRLPGSVYHKHSHVRLVTIRERNDTEYELADLAERIHEMPALVTCGGGEFDFNTAGKAKLGANGALTGEFHEGGTAGNSRFDALSAVIGNEIKTWHEGRQSIEDAWNRIIGYNEGRIIPPWPEDRLKHEFEALRRKHIKEKGERAPELKQVSATPLGTLDFSAIPPRKWILGRRLQGEQITVLIAPPGTGKTTHVLQEAVAIATGRGKITQAAVHRSGPVWVYNLEEPIPELHRRAAAICTKFDIHISEISDRIYLNSGIARPLIMAEETRGGVVATPDVAGIIAEIQKHDIVALIVDPLLRAHRCNENSNAQIDFVCQQFARIAAATGCGIELVHHTRKPPGADTSGHAGNPDSARGASALIASARQAFTLMGMAGDEAAKLGVSEEERWRYVRLDNAKSNQSERNGTVTWFRHESVTLANGTDDLAPDDVGVLERVDMRNAETDAKLRTQKEWEELARAILPLIDDDPEISANAAAKRLMKDGYDCSSERTLRRRIEDAIPTAPGCLALEFNDSQSKIWRYRDGDDRTSPHRFRIEKAR